MPSIWTRPIGTQSCCWTKATHSPWLAKGLPWSSTKSCQPPCLHWSLSVGTWVGGGALVGGVEVVAAAGGADVVAGAGGLSDAGVEGGLDGVDVADAGPDPVAAGPDVEPDGGPVMAVLGDSSPTSTVELDGRWAVVAVSLTSERRTGPTTTRSRPPTRRNGTTIAARTSQT